MSHEDHTLIWIILNGKAAADQGLRNAVEVMRSRGYAIEIRVTWESGDAARYAVEAVQKNVGVIVAAGGDGTVNEVVTGMVQAGESPSSSLGVLPFGTANDFAVGCGIPTGDPLAALELVTSHAPKLVDVGVVNERCFFNVATAGFGAEVTVQTPVGMKRALGGTAYSLQALVMALKMTAWQTRVTIGDDQEEGAMIVLAVGNGRQAGGGYQLTPHAVLDDGLLDLMVVHDVELTRIGEILNELNDARNPANSFVHYLQAKSFVVETEEPIQMNLDGEPIRSSRFEFSVLHKRIPLIVSDVDDSLFGPKGS